MLSTSMTCKVDNPSNADLRRGGSSHVSGADAARRSHSSSLFPATTNGASIALLPSLPPTAHPAISRSASGDPALLKALVVFRHRVPVYRLLRPRW